MDGALSVSQRPATVAAERRENLRHDRRGHFLGSIGADIKAGGRMKRRTW